MLRSMDTDSYLARHTSSQQLRETPPALPGNTPVVRRWVPECGIGIPNPNRNAPVRRGHKFCLTLIYV